VINGVSSVVRLELKLQLAHQNALEINSERCDFTRAFNCGDLLLSAKSATTGGYQRLDFFHPEDELPADSINGEY
jgi:hypothetical protein